MRKLFSIFLLALFFFGMNNIYGQAAIDILFTATNGAGTLNLNVGLDPTATVGIDPSLGESDLPPFPPPGVFEIRYDLAPGAPGLSSYQDYRPATFPYTGTVTHTLWWQTESAGTSININYNLPTGAAMRIVDNINGTFVNIGPFTGTGVATIPGSYTVFGTKAYMYMDYTNIAPVVLGPIFNVAPASLSFGNVNVGSNAVLPVTISNPGTAPLVVSNIASDNAQFTFAPSVFPLTIPVGGNSVLNVTFAPTAGGAVSGNLTFTHDAPGSPTSYAVSGTGYVPAPVFGVSPVAPLSFGSVNVGSSANLNVTVNNTGDAPLTLSGIVSSDPQFTFTPNAFPVNIAAGGNSVFVVTFTPTAAATVNANLTFTHNAAGSPSNYALTGIGFTTAPVFNLSAASLAFGNVSVGGNVTLPVTVSNTGNAALTISGIVSSDAHYTFAPNTFPINVIAGGNAVFNVTFAPTVAGAVPGTLTFTHNAAGSPSVLNLSGTGQTQGGELKFAIDSQNLLDGTTNNPDAVILRGYTGQPLKALQFDVVVGHLQGRLILRSVQRGAAITAPEFNFSYEIVPGPTLPDGSSTDRIKVVILGNGTNAILPNPGDQEIMKFNFDIVDITGPNAFTYNALFNVVGATETPVINANISTGVWETINIFNGTTMGLLGDVNLDDQVNILDILLMIDHILGRVTLTGQAFTQGDIAPWTVGAPLPVPDGTINVLDLSVLQNIVLTGLYPSGTPVYKAIANQFDVVSNGLEKMSPGMDAKLTFYLTNTGIAVEIESDKKVKGVQMELNDLRSLIPSNIQMSSIFDQALYYQNNAFLRMLSFDGSALPIQPGTFVLATLPFNLYDPQSIKVENIIVADENNRAMPKVEIEIRYDGAPGIPLDYLLSQNFPNPFNPSTSVQFTVPKEGLVTIKVYDMLGQAVADLYSGNAQAGTYTLNWDGKDSSGKSVSSGNYIYKMVAGEFVQSKKMTFLK
ncbi:MAG: choice-of-anchor D domain-containing protein [Ignavibacteriaceae bacterium]|nr:choice-of-anchor D domain-containing protein [Ignavibacteriaceae bacterium]